MPAAPTPNFRATPAGGPLTLDAKAYSRSTIHSGSLMESGLKPETLRSRIRDLTTTALVVLYIMVKR
ncbi:hypothetical protein AVEN_201435-1, partial [Araneus ventricosus]